MVAASNKESHYTLHLGSCHDVLDTLPENSVDSIVTDPPYEINFMAKTWDNAGVAFNPVTWQKALRVLKPGGHMLVFGHSRKMHRIIVAIEDAGFEIRDTLMWLYGSGFPKSHNVGLSVDKKLGHGDRGHRISTASRYHPDGTFEPNGEKLEPYMGKTSQGLKWQGWGTALKPAYEPIVLARKPFKGSIAENVLEHGTGGINIDECRVKSKDAPEGRKRHGGGKEENHTSFYLPDSEHESPAGRFPANVMHDGSEESTKDMWDWETDSDASRYFYCAKANKKDRDEGLDYKQAELPASAEFRPNHMEKAQKGEGGNPYGRWKPVKNTHPTVKPTELMQYLVRLITPKGGTVLDPFMGSGSTGKATMIENNERNANYHFIGIDLEQEYIDIAKARIEYGISYQEHKAKEKEAETVDENQTSIFDFLGSQQNRS